MIDTTPDHLALRAVSHVVFRWVPGRAATKLAEFSHTEYGSGLDMLAAAALTTSRARRRLYYRHALDELEHARLFRERAAGLANDHGGALAVLSDHARVLERGILTSEPLFRQLDETAFLAFVWIHERDGERQFRTYAHVLRDDPDTSRMFTRIFEDERFHVTYSRKELDRVAQTDPAAVRRAVWHIRLRRLRDGWLRLGHGMGQALAWVWLGLVYALLVAPLALLTRWTERLPGGFVEVDEAPAAAAATAAEQG